MRLWWSWLTVCLLFCLLQHSEAQKKSVSSEIEITYYQKNDDAEGFIYYILDDFLADPTLDRLTIFEKNERLWRPLKTESELLAYVTLLCNEGYYRTQFGEINGGVDAYERAWDIYKTNSLSGFDLIEYCLKPLGNNYTILGDHYSAENIVKNYLMMAEHDQNADHIASALINLSIIYHVTGRYHEAIELLNQAMEIRILKPQKKGLLFSNLASNYFQLNDLGNAKKTADAALTFFNKYPTSQTPLHVVNVYKILARVAIQNNELEKASDYLSAAQSVVSYKPVAFKNRELAKLQNATGDLLHLKKAHRRALQSYQQALTVLIPHYKPKDDFDQPDRTLLFAENTIKESLDGMAAVYRETNEPEKALACYELSLAVEDLLYDTYNYQDSKLQQQVENRNRACQAISLLYQLARKHNDEQYVRDAFQLAERSKALVLKEAIEKNYRRYQTQHDSLFKKESVLVNKKARLANDIALEQLKGDQADITRINHLLDLQMQVAVGLKATQKLIDQKYPENTSGDTVDIAQLQHRLADDAILLEYVADKDNLYVFRISKQFITLEKIEDARIVYDNAKLLVDLLSSPSAISNDIETYKRIAFDLYKSLRIPKINGQELLIIPDGILGTIPFEVLLFEKVNHTNYSTFPYLLLQSNIVYQPTASLYLKEHTRESGSRNVLGLFPLFENTDQALPHSRTESENIKKHFKGKYVLGAAATKKEFLENAGRYSILHLSTHATAGSFLESPSIQFIDSTLYLTELYGLQIRPSLVVASACDMGIGKLSKGEGALSLARGFQYAGAKNIIFSLWKVNDYAAAQVISKFYEGYDKSGMEATSLRQAKINYLESENIPNTRKSPYYWAAFIYYGDIADEGSKNSLSTYSLLLTLIGVSVIAFLGLRTMRKKRQ